MVIIMDMGSGQYETEHRFGDSPMAELDFDCPSEAQMQTGRWNPVGECQLGLQLVAVECSVASFPRGR